MTREDIDSMNPMQPFCFETDREEVWYKCGLVKGADIADRAMIERVCKWLDEHIYDYLWGFFLHRKELIKDLKQVMEK